MSDENQQQDPEIQFDIELKEGEDWGVKLTNDLQIVGIKSGGQFDGKAAVGDYIVQVNNSAVKSIEEFEQAVMHFGPILHIQVSRGLKTSEVQLLPPEREKNVQRKDGYSYQMVQIDYQKGCKFGLGIKHFQNKVLVSRVDAGSLSAKSLALGDRIVDINGTPVTDKDVARNMLMRSLQKTRTVSLVIERAEMQEAKDIVGNALRVSEMQPPSVAMASDVQDILKRQKEKMQNDAKAPHKQATSLIRRSLSNDPKRHVSVGNNKKEVIIATDHEGKNLRHVPSQK